MSETYLAWLVLFLFVVLGALSLKADVVKIESNFFSFVVFLWQIVFAGVLSVSLVFLVIWAFVTVMS